MSGFSGFPGFSNWFIDEYNNNQLTNLSTMTNAASPGPTRNLGGPNMLNEAQHINMAQQQQYIQQTRNQMWDRQLEEYNNSENVAEALNMLHNWMASRAGGPDLGLTALDPTPFMDI